MAKKPETPEEALRRNVRRLKTEGLDAATEAAIALMRDPAAPSQAKSAVINATFRAAGLFGKGVEDDDNTPPHAMTGEQLERAIARFQRDLAAEGDDDAESVFE